MRSIVAAALLLLWAPVLSAAPVMPMRSFDRLVTGNGFSVASYNRTTARVDFFLEHPFRFLEPNNPGATDLCFTANDSRNLAYDTYYGWRITVGDAQAGVWLPQMNLDSVAYIPGTGIINAQHSWTGTGALAGASVQAQTWNFMPMEVADPVLLQIVQITNAGNAPIQIAPYALYNFLLGVATSQTPSGDAENALYDSMRHAFYEWGPQPPNGTIAFVALTPEAFRTISGGNNNVYMALQNNADLDDTTATTAPTDNVVPGFEWANTTLQPGQSVTITSAVIWAADENAAPHVDNLVAWINGRDPMTLIQDEQSGWTSWHTSPPDGFSPDQQSLWLQQAAFIRMAQVQEPGNGQGAIMAGLPPSLGDPDSTWNITWVRDMAYAVVALARIGHLKEALAAINFQANAGPGLHTAEVGEPYRLSVTRYFGDGEEESDCNQYGPNIEFDGWGLFLWSVGEYVRAGGDLTAIRALWPVLTTQIADVLLTLVQQDGLITADSSIWEVHWDGQQKHFTYTSLAAARGFAEIAGVAYMLGETADGDRYLDAAARVRDAVAKNIDPNGVMGQSTEALASGSGYIDASTVEAINWGVIDPMGMVAAATIGVIQKNLLVASGMGYMRDQDGAWYDSQEWVFVDLRLVPVFRAMGNAAAANELMSWIEGQALDNDFHIAEIQDPTTGAYEGTIPMVGFGAAAYIIAWTGLVMPAIAGEYGDRPGAGVDAGSETADAGAQDGLDAGAVDAGPPQPADAGNPLAGPGAPISSGCQCGTTEPTAAMLLLALAARRRR